LRSVGPENKTGPGLEDALDAIDRIQTRWRLNEVAKPVFIPRVAQGRPAYEASARGTPTLSPAEGDRDGAAGENFSLPGGHRLVCAARLTDYGLVAITDRGPWPVGFAVPTGVSVPVLALMVKVETSLEPKFAT
jgi:hypothetical protein